MVRLLQLALTVAVTAFILQRVGVGLEDVRALDPARWRPRWGLLGLSCLTLLAGYAASAGLWGLMVRELGGPAVGVRTSCRVYLLANLGRYVPGKLWQLAGLTLLARRQGVPAAVAAGAAMLGQGVSLAGAVVVGALAFFGPASAGRSWGTWAVVAALVVIAVTTVPPVFRWLLALGFRLARTPMPEGLRPGAGFGLRWTALYTANWMVYAGAFWLLARSFGVFGSPLELAPAFAAAYVLGYVMVFAPAGIGVREGFLIAFLEPVTGAAAAAALAVIARLWTTVVELVPAGLLLASGSLPSREGTG